mmetsp:Transcript_88290/g.283193  ORF Transcript_88290/g.283193 Transcript_88290/m.283193 type:complete len:247 (-) Transcript_88290:3-743(-)
MYPRSWRKAAADSSKRACTSRVGLSIRARRMLGDLSEGAPLKNEEEAAPRPASCRAASETRTPVAAWAAKKLLRPMWYNQYCASTPVTSVAVGNADASGAYGSRPRQNATEGPSANASRSVNPGRCSEGGRPSPTTSLAGSGASPVTVAAPLAIPCQLRFRSVREGAGAATKVTRVASEHRAAHTADTAANKISGAKRWRRKNPDALRGGAIPEMIVRVWQCGPTTSRHKTRNDTPCYSCVNKKMA